MTARPALTRPQFLRLAMHRYPSRLHLPCARCLRPRCNSVRGPRAPLGWASPPQRPRVLRGRMRAHQGRWPQKITSKSGSSVIPMAAEDVLNGFSASLCLVGPKVSQTPLVYRKRWKYVKLTKAAGAHRARGIVFEYWGVLGLNREDMCRRRDGIAPLLLSDV